MYLMIFSSFIGTKASLSINMEFFQLSLHRIILLLFLCLIIFRLLKTNAINILPEGKSRNIIIFYIFWFAYAICSVIWVQNYASWFKAVYFIGLGLTGFLYISMYLKEEKDFAFVLKLMLVMIILHNLIGWHEMLTGKFYFIDMDKLDPDNLMIDNADKRTPVSVFGNTNDYALFLVFGVFISLICFKINRAIVWKAISIATIISCILLIICTGSRGGLIGLSLGLFAFLFFFSRKAKVKCILGSLVLIALLYVTPILDYSEPLIDYASSLKFYNRDYEIFMADHSQIRKDLIKNGFIFLKDTFGFGVGAGNIEYWMEHYRVYDTGYKTITNIHNWWMEILTAYGVLVFAGYLWVYTKLAKGFYRATKYSQDKFIRSISLGLLCFMIAFIISSISSSSNINNEWIWLFWGICIAFYNYAAKETKNKCLLHTKTNHIIIT